ncbi:MAG: SulP family inorganic anion transporter [Cytophagales bacterium]|nr:SulP family inorganic anion transporter [Cytophagales bacterium]
MNVNKDGFLRNLKYDFPSSLVVLLVALPLCLGIALASGAPLFSGIIAGIIGGVVVGFVSGSHTGVSGPAAGLAVVVLNAITELGSFELFLVAIILAGVIQIILGILKGGIIAYYFPSSVISGMLAGIGIIIFLKQLPHAFGDDRDVEGDLEFFQKDGENTFSEIWNMFDYVSAGAIIITIVSLAILLLWESRYIKKNQILQFVPGPLLAVMSGVFLNAAFRDTTLKLKPDQVVNIPIMDGLNGFISNLSHPDFSALFAAEVYITAVVIAVVASLETLLCVEASDKLDRHHRSTPVNRELIGQGIGNILSGLVGGLPVTQVIVRSSANIQSGARTKTSAITHGMLILICVILIPSILNMIPLATLAAILFIVGYKLARPVIFKTMYKQGKEQFVPFIVTVTGIIFTDLLVGLGLGLGVAIVFILYNQYVSTYKMSRVVKNGKENILLELSQDLTFFNKAGMLKTLDSIPDNSEVIIDASNTNYIHYDVQEILEDFLRSTKERNIDLNLVELFSLRPSSTNNKKSISSNSQQMHSVRSYKNVNRNTLTKEQKKTIAVITRFDDESLDAIKYAVDTFGVEAKYTLQSIYSFENALGATSLFPDEIRIEMMDKLTKELGAVRSMLGDIQPEIAIQFEFGSPKQILEDAWSNKEFDFVVVPNGRQAMFGMAGITSSTSVPILVTPKPQLIQESDF